MYDEQHLRQQLQKQLPELYGKNCFGDYFDDSKNHTLIWESEGFGVFVHSKGWKTVECSLFMFDRDYAVGKDHLHQGQHLMAVIDHISKKQVSKTLLKFQQIAEQCAAMRTAGWKFSVKNYNSSGHQYKKIVACNPLKTHDFQLVNSKYSPISERFYLSTSSKKLATTLSTLPIDPVEDFLQILKPVSSGNNRFTEIAEASQALLGQKSIEHETKLLLTRHPNLDGQQLTDLIESVDGSELNHQTLAQAVENKLKSIV